MQKGSGFMADISQEIQKFRDAEKGEEVRGSMISLAEKVNSDGEDALTEVAEQVTRIDDIAAEATQTLAEANTATDGANAAKASANTAALNANNAAANAAETRQDILDRLAAGEFKGEKGNTGEQGPQGQSGVNVPASSRMYIYTDDANNSAIHCVYDDALYDAPPLNYNDTTGAISWTYDNGQ